MYLTCLVFVVIVLGGIARMSGFSLWKFLKYIKDEMFTVLGTSSSESVVPQLMRKLETRWRVQAGRRPGRAFGPDLQSRWPVHLLHDGGDLYRPGHQHTADRWWTSWWIMGVLMVTSKGSAGVTGSGFITLAATLASMGNIPVAGMVLLLGVDRFMSEARAITNTIGNAVGTMAIAKLGRRSGQ